MAEPVEHFSIGREPLEDLEPLREVAKLNAEAAALVRQHDYLMKMSTNLRTRYEAKARWYAQQIAKVRKDMTTFAAKHGDPTEIAQYPKQ